MTIRDISLHSSAVLPSRPQMEQRELNCSARRRSRSGTWASTGELKSRSASLVRRIVGSKLGLPFNHFEPGAPVRSNKRTIAESFVHPELPPRCRPGSNVLRSRHCPVAEKRLTSLSSRYWAQYTGTEFLQKTRRLSHLLAQTIHFMILSILLSVSYRQAQRAHQKSAGLHRPSGLKSSFGRQSMSESLLPPHAKFLADGADGGLVQDLRCLGKHDAVFDLNMRLVKIA
jgi:hypothetical protein